MLSWHIITRKRRGRTVQDHKIFWERHTHTPHSHHFCYIQQALRGVILFNVILLQGWSEKKNGFPARVAACVTFPHSPHVPVLFSGYSRSSHLPKMCRWGELACLNCSSRREQGAWDVPCNGKASCPGWVPTFHCVLLGQAPMTLNWNKRVKIIILFC